MTDNMEGYDWPADAFKGEEWLDVVYGEYGTLSGEVTMKSQSSALSDGKRLETNWQLLETSTCYDGDQYDTCHFTFSRNLSDMPIISYYTEVLISTVAFDSRQPEYEWLAGDFQRIPITSVASAGIALAAAALSSYLVF